MMTDDRGSYLLCSNGFIARIPVTLRFISYCYLLCLE